MAKGQPRTLNWVMNSKWVPEVWGLEYKQNIVALTLKTNDLGRGPSNVPNASGPPSMTLPPKSAVRGTGGTKSWSPVSLTPGPVPGTQEVLSVLK